MNFRSCILCAAFFVTLFANSVHAQTRVGEAVVVQNEVVRVGSSATLQINVGDGLLRDEVVRTGVASAARLVMADNTNLSLGPSATIKLDRTVFNDEHSYRDIAVRLTTGAFRFVTGNSAKAAYKITTPLALIGVRGTILDILSERGRTTVVLQEGASTVCGRTTIHKTNNSPWTFAATCAAAAGLCTVTQYADATPPVDDVTGMLCGR
jgi:hypothetical protein